MQTILEKLTNSLNDMPVGVRHFANAHFPGLYSIVLHKANGLLRRLFIAPPNELHSSLQDYDAPFLYHAHAYNFKETAVLGTVTNVNIAEAKRDDHSADIREYYEYQFQSGIDKGEPKIKYCGSVRMIEEGVQIIGPGNYFKLRHNVIHRVIFTPCRMSGWFCCMVEETKRMPAKEFVYSRDGSLTDVPDADILYLDINEREAKTILAQVISVFKSVNRFPMVGE